MDRKPTHIGEQWGDFDQGGGRPETARSGKLRREGEVGIAVDISNGDLIRFSQSTKSKMTEWRKERISEE